jgi:hypothetical protein
MFLSAYLTISASKINKPKPITSMSTATGTFKLNPMKRSPLTFQTQPATTTLSNCSTPVGHEVDTVWRRHDDKKPAEPPAHAKTVKFDDKPKIVRTTSSNNAAVSDAEEEEEPTEEELLRRGIHLTRRLSSEVQHREFNWDEDDDDDLALPTSWSMNMLPLSANRSPAPSNTSTVNSPPAADQVSPNRSATNEAAATEPKEPKKINSPPWKITQPASVTPIDKQLKELSEQRALQERQQQQQQQQQRKQNHNLFNNHNQDHHDYNGLISRPNNEFWRPHEALVDRYRYTDAEKRYRPDIPQPKPDLFNETSGQVETMTRRGRLGGFGRFSESPRIPDENKKHEPVPNAKSRLEEQEEIMRLTRENARKRKEEEQKREKEQQEAAKRKAEELVARIAAKKAQEQEKLRQGQEEQQQQEKEKNKQLLQEHQQPQQQLKQNELKKPVESKFLPSKPVILKPKRRRGSSVTSEDNPSFRAVSSVLGDHDNNIWTGKTSTNNSMLWNPSSVTRSASDGNLWGPISGIYNNENKNPSAYKKDIENSVITSPSTQPSRVFQWGTVNGTSNDNDNDRNDSASGIINKESSAISVSNGATSNTGTTNNGTTSNNSSNSPVNANVKIDSPNLSRGFSRFFPSSQTGEPREKVEQSLPEPKSNRMIIQSHTVDDYLNNFLQRDAQSAPRVHLPGLAAIEANTDGVARSLFKSPPLRSIQALQSTIAEKLGETVVPPAAPAVLELPHVAAPVISSKIPPLVSTSPAVIKYDKVFVPQAASNKRVEASAKTQLDVRSAVSELEDTLIKSVKTPKPVVKVNLLGDAIDVNNPSSTAWDKGRVEAELTFGTSTYYVDPGNAKVYLREFKPRKDIFVALLVPGSRKKVTTTYKIGKGNVKR